MTNWIIPCNANYYDVEGAFAHLGRVDWKQSRRIEAGDIVYIYVGRPVKAILFKCRATKVNMDSIEIDDSAFVLSGEIAENYGNYMELVPIRKFDRTSLTLDILVANGLQGNVQGPRRSNEQLNRLFARVENV